MSQSIRFLRSCPSCSKKLQISVELLGKDVVCSRCGSQFSAVAEKLYEMPAADPIDQKVEALIQAADRQLGDFYDEVAFRN